MWPKIRYCFSLIANIRIGLDIDEVICDWVGGWCKKFNYRKANHWKFSYKNKQHFEELIKRKELEEFYLGLKPKIKGSKMPFEPNCYITSRSIPNEITKQWLQNNGFPTAPVLSVPFGASKVEAAKSRNLTFFVDDGIHNFIELNKAGICCFLFDAPHNRKLDVGYKRIKNLSELSSLI